MNGLLTRVIRRFRGESFTLDPRIPSSYLVGLLLEKALARLRGVLLSRRISPAIFASRRVRIRGARLVSFEGYASFGADSLLDALSSDGVTLGHGFSLGRFASVECTGSLRTLGKGLATGANVGIGSYSFLGCAGGITIGADTILGNYVSMHAENHNSGDHQLPIRLQGVTHKGISVGNNCWIGAKATILDGARIGDNCIVAAGAVVREGVYEPWSLLAGVPARVVKTLR